MGCHSQQDKFEREGGKLYNLKRIDELATETERVTNKHQKSFRATAAMVSCMRSALLPTWRMRTVETTSSLLSPGLPRQRRRRESSRRHPEGHGRFGPRAHDGLQRRILRPAGRCGRCESKTPTEYVSGEQHSPSEMQRKRQDQTNSASTASTLAEVRRQEVERPLLQQHGP